MLAALTLAATLAPAHPPPLADAIERYRTVESYRVTLRTARGDGDEQLRYAYRKPGFVRIEFVRPHAGAVLVYSPLTRRVHLWPFGVGRFPELDLGPRNPLVRGTGGQTVDRSDVGALYEHVGALLARGRWETSGEVSIDGRAARYLAVTGAPGQTVAGVHRYELWFDPVTRFPLRVLSRDEAGAVIERVTFESLEVDIPLADALFDPGNAP